MADDKTQQDGRDQRQINGNEDYELSYVQEKLGVTRAQVKSAIDAVGNDRAKVEEYLKGRSSNA